MSDILDVSDRSEFQDLLDTEDALVVKFWATWCGPCKQMAPHFEAASKKSDATFVAVDVDEADWAMVEYGIKGVPAVKIFRGGEYVKDIATKPADRTAIKLLSDINETV